MNVALYNVLGREAQTLRQGRTSAGQHQVTLNASGLSSGVYFLRVQGDGFTRTKRLTVAH